MLETEKEDFRNEEIEFESNFNSERIRKGLELQYYIHKLSKSQGYWPDTDISTTIPRQVMNIVGEVSELVDLFPDSLDENKQKEELTGKKSEDYATLLEYVTQIDPCLFPCDKDIPLNALEEELADIFIRVLDLAAARNNSFNYLDPTDMEDKLRKSFPMKSSSLYFFKELDSLSFHKHISQASIRAFNQLQELTANDEGIKKMILEQISRENTHAWVNRRHQILDNFFIMVNLCSELNESYRRGTYNKNLKDSMDESIEGYIFLKMILWCITVAEMFRVDLFKAVDIKHHYNIGRTDIKEF